MEYIIKRSRRKSVSIYVTKEAKIEVHAPLKLSKTYIDNLVSEKEEWLLTHLSKMKQELQKRDTFRLENHNMVLILGSEYPICDTSENTAVFDGASVSLPLGDFAWRKEAMIKLYKRLAHDILPQIVEKHASIMNVSPKSMRITSAKTRWGSCSGDNRLNFSWYLMMTPMSVIDYVVVHELSHMLEHNHSAAFWGIVSRFCPDFQKEKQSLKVLSQRLQEENW